MCSIGCRWHFWSKIDSLLHFPLDKIGIFCYREKDTLFFNPQSVLPSIAAFKSYEPSSLFHFIVQVFNVVICLLFFRLVPFVACEVKLEQLDATFGIRTNVEIRDAVCCLEENIRQQPKPCSDYEGHSCVSPTVQAFNWFCSSSFNSTPTIT